MAKDIPLKKEKKFLDLKVPAYKNKKNGQITIVLPRKELKKIVEMNDKDETYIPKMFPIRIFKWRNR